MKFKKLRSDARTPAYGSADAAGADLYVCSPEEITIAPGETAVPTNDIHIMKSSPLSETQDLN